METVTKSDLVTKTSPSRRVFEHTLVWSAVTISISLLLCVLAGTIHLLPQSIVVVCGATLTYLTAVLALVAVGYTAIGALKK